MNVTLLGHASVLIELSGTTCLMDPVLADPFEEGTVVSCPRRIVDAERLPHIDILIVSHRHPDHFDVPSLARVPRDCDAICPADALIVYALESLGFERIHPVELMAPIAGDGFNLFPTRSEVRTVREFGMVFDDESGAFWNQVDTALSPETIAAVQNRFGRIDLLFAMYASQNFEFFDTHATRFPFETHGRNLENVLRIGPRLAVPGSAGFRFAGDHAWLNPFLFPISRERFAEDLRRLDHGIAVAIADPGDVFEVTAAAVTHRPGASPCARMEEDDTWRIRFDPAAPIPELFDPNPEGCPHAHLAGICDRFVRERIAAYARAGYDSDDPVIRRYREHQVRYVIAIVFPDHSVQEYQFSFASDGLRLTAGLEPQQPANMSHRIAASALADWIEHKRSFFYVRGFSRRSSVLSRVARDGAQVKITPIPMPDLLMHYLLNAAPESRQAAKHHIDFQLAAAKRAG